MNFVLTAVFLALALTASALKQQITFYTELDFDGDSVTFQSNQRSLQYSSAFTRKAKSMCGIGYWFAMWDVDYANTAYNISSSEEVVCSYDASRIHSLNALRHLGASDMTKPSISLYEDPNFWNDEVLVEGIGHENLPFQPQSYAATGKSRWTFYALPNFEGKATCVLPSTTDKWVATNHKFVEEARSVVRGCALEAQRNILKLKEMRN